jgi:hypothetical protein
MGEAPILKLNGEVVEPLDVVADGEEEGKKVKGNGDREPMH